MPKCYIGVGSNLGDRHHNINQATQDLHNPPHIIVCRTSQLYETKAEEMDSNAPDFLNGVIEIDTDVPPSDLLSILLSIEEKQGRQRKNSNRYESRPIDLDILLYGDEVVDQPNLKIPHPKICSREFVLRPLTELAPDIIIQKINKTSKNMLEEYYQIHSSMS